MEVNLNLSISLKISLSAYGRSISELNNIDLLIDDLDIMFLIDDLLDIGLMAVGFYRGRIYSITTDLW